MQRMLEIIANDGVVLRAQVHGPQNADRLILSHGNGLAIGGYAAYWSRLVNEFQVVLLDFRGHGWSDCGDVSHHSWEQFELDLDTVLTTVDSVLGRRRTVGVFHSLSAIVSLRHIRRFGSKWDGLLLFDPPLMPPDGHPLQTSHFDEMRELSARVLKRQEFFVSPSELAQQFRRSRIAARWLPQSCDDMATALLRQCEDGNSWRLACPPAFESKIFDSNVDQSLWTWLSQSRASLKLICADPDVPGVQPSAHIGRSVAGEFGLDYECIRETTHFLQIESPEACAAVTRQFCAGLLECKHEA